MDEFDAVIAAAKELDIAPRGQRWTHLSLCVLDAVYSWDSRHSATDVCLRYAEHADLTRPRTSVAEAGQVIGTNDEQPLTDFLDEVRGMGPDVFSGDVLKDQQRVGAGEDEILRGAAALRFAGALVTVGIATFADAVRLPLDPARSEHVDGRLRRVAGDDGADVRLSHFWMLVAAEDLVKPDPRIMGWLERTLGEQPSTYAATNLVAEAAEELHCTPWELGRAIWEAELARSDKQKS